MASELLNRAFPSVLVSGFSELPQAGDLFEVTTHEAVKKGVSVAPPVLKSGEASTG